MGKVFLRDSEMVGNRSIHFDQQIGPYLPYEGDIYKNSKLKDGSPWPSRKVLTDYSFNSNKRKFCGSFEFEFEGTHKYELVFDTQFMCVLSGNVVKKLANGKEELLTSGEDFCYVNADLKKKINIETLRWLENEGASDKTMSYVRKYLLLSS